MYHKVIMLVTGGGGGLIIVIVYLWKIKFAIFDRPEMKYVRAKMYLARHLDRRTPKNYFEPCHVRKQKAKITNLIQKKRQTVMGD